MAAMAAMTCPWLEADLARREQGAHEHERDRDQREEGGVCGV